MSKMIPLKSSKKVIIEIDINNDRTGTIFKIRRKNPGTKKS